MSLIEATPNLHHPRPTVARLPSSKPSGSSVIRPGIQYPVTPVQRPHAPAPSSPDVRLIHSNNNGHAYPHAHVDPNVWKSQPPIPIPDRYNSVDSTSPTVVTRRSAKSSDATSPTYADDHVITYPEINRIAGQSTIRPAVLRQRSASSPPQHLKPPGAYVAAPAARADPTAKPKINRNNTGNVHFTPDLQFNPSNNGPNAIMEAVRKDVLAAWPAGIKSDNEARGQWTVRCNTNIWSAGGQDGVIAGKMITSLFGILAVQGYSYLCSIQNTSLLRAPRHLFTSSPPSRTHFFSLSFSLGKNKLRFMDAPHDLNVAISNALKHATLFDVEEIDEADAPPRRTGTMANEEDSDEEEEDTTRRIYTYRLTNRVTVPRSKKDVSLFLTRSAKADMLLLLSQLLKTIASFGYRLDASVPLGRVGLFGLRGRREIWVFKSVQWTKERNPN